MSWIYLLVAIGLEVSGTTCMKLSDGFAKTTPSIFIFVFYALSMVSLTLAVQHLEISISYAVWSGLGTVAIAFIGVAWFGESFTLVKAIALAMIVVGVVAVNLGDR